MRITLAAILWLALGQGPIHAGPFDGLFLVNDGQAKVKVEPCGEHLCGTIAWVADPIDTETGRPRLDVHNPDARLRARPILGMRLFELAPGPEGWTGEIYNSRDGKRYDITLSSDEKGLAVKGCLLGSLLCRIQIWPRVEP